MKPTARTCADTDWRAGHAHHRTCLRAQRPARHDGSQPRGRGATMTTTDSSDLVRGVGVSPGRAAGPVAQVRPPAGEPDTGPPVPEDRVDPEAERIEIGRAHV